MAEHGSRNVLNELAYMMTVMITVLFMTERFIYPVAGVLCVILCLLLLSTKGKFRCPMIITTFISYGALILVQILVQPSKYLSLDRAVKELSRLCIYAAIVLLAANTYIREDRFLRLWKSVCFASVLVAILQFAKIERVSNMLISIYGDSIEWDVAMKYSTLDLFRAGSVFVNSNTYAKFTLAVLAMFLSIDQRKASNVPYATVSSLIIAASLLLAGSRTGVVIALLMVMGFYLRGAMGRKARTVVTELLMLVMLAAGGAIGIAICLKLGADGLGGVRALQIVAGLGNSIAYKLETFRNMAGQFSTMNILVGMGPFESDIRYLTKIDFDLGYLLLFYGIAGCVIYACMLYDICRHRRQMPRRYSYFNMQLAFIIVAFGLTGGTFLNLRVFAIFSTMLYVEIVDGNFRPIRASWP